MKLNSGIEYRGVLACLDGYLNIAMEQTEEFEDGQLKAKYGDCFIRGNNGRSPQTLLAAAPLHQLLQRSKTDRVLNIAFSLSLQFCTSRHKPKEGSRVSPFGFFGRMSSLLNLQLGWLVALRCIHSVLLKLKVWPYHCYEALNVSSIVLIVALLFIAFELVFCVQPC